MGPPAHLPRTELGPPPTTLVAQEDGPIGCMHRLSSKAPPARAPGRLHLAGCRKMVPSSLLQGTSPVPCAPVPCGPSSCPHLVLVVAPCPATMDALENETLEDGPSVSPCCPSVRSYCPSVLSCCPRCLSVRSGGAVVVPGRRWAAVVVAGWRWPIVPANACKMHARLRES